MLELLQHVTTTTQMLLTIALEALPVKETILSSLVPNQMPPASRQLRHSAISHPMAWKDTVELC